MSTNTISRTGTSSSVFHKMNDALLSVPFFKWFISKGYSQGVFWAVMISVVSVTNDVLMRFLGERLHPVEISFFRFFFSMVSILALMVSSGSTLFKTKRPMMHVLRAILGALALGLCCYSVNIMPLSENTTIMFCEPLFFLPLAYILLKERVDAPRWIATIVGFIGLMIILRPGTEAFRVVAFVPMTAAILFALSNVMVKKMTGEHASTMLFYFGVGTTLFALIPLPFFWEMPTLSELGLLVLLGIGGNMIQVCLFRAFSATEASALAPFRYVEFIISALFGYLLFSQIPTVWIFGGAALITLSTFYITIMETRKEKKA
ncbi:MAG: DMT family transporter [Alphaproteobacteria bacterium]|nr:DMT family transporter [Alphaproteobacteria bacterium]